MFKSFSERFLRSVVLTAISIPAAGILCVFMSMIVPTKIIPFVFGGLLVLVFFASYVYTAKSVVHDNLNRKAIYSFLIATISFPLNSVIGGIVSKFYWQLTIPAFIVSYLAVFGTSYLLIGKFMQSK